MKVVRNTCDKELGGEIKSACEWKLLQKFTLKLPKIQSLLERLMQNI